MVSAPAPAALRAALLEAIARGAHAPLPEADFEALALGIFAHQYAANAPYRRFCDRRGATPGTVRRAADVPAVPTDAFKAAPLVAGDPAAAVAVFRTSGTTAGRERRGAHHFPELALYEAALAAGFRAHLLPDGARLPLVSLVPRPADAPDSSLSHMVGTVAETMAGEGGGWFVSPDGGIDLAGFLAALRRAEAGGAPVLVVGTAFAFVHALDAMAEAGAAVRLPPGSRVMDTGGFKGRSREVTRAELYGAIEARLGVPAAWCVNEYGMTEMSSQFYDGAAGSAGPAEGRLHRGPAWVRTVAADPETLAPLPPGETGVLRHLDLANLHSVMAIQTADLGVVHPGGFRVLGRATGAEARGCSLAMDDLLSALKARGG